MCHPLMWNRIFKWNQPAHHINYLRTVQYMHGEEKVDCSQTYFCQRCYQRNKLFNIALYKPKLWKYTMTVCSIWFFYLQMNNKINFGFGVRCQCFQDKRIFSKNFFMLHQKIPKTSKSRDPWKIYAGITNIINQRSPSLWTWVSSTQAYRVMRDSS